VDSPGGLDGARSPAAKHQPLSAELTLWITCHL